MKRAMRIGAWLILIMLTLLGSTIAAAVLLGAVGAMLLLKARQVRR